MMASWTGKGIAIGWAGGDGSGDLEVLSNVPAWAMEAIYLHLAIRLAPSFGKMVSMETKANAKSAMDVVLGRCVVPRDRQVGGYAGSGHRWGNMPEDEAPLTGASGNVIFGG
jgi:hypothetical protein